MTGNRPALLNGLAALAVLSALVLGACSRNVGSQADPTPSKGVPPGMSVATVDFPSTWLAEQVGGDALEVERIDPTEVSGNGADMFVYIPGLDSAVDAAAASLPPDSVVDLTADLTTLASPRDPKTRDPYIWFDPLNVGAMAETLSDALAEASPTPYDAKQYFGLRALATQSRAAEVDEGLQESLDTCRIPTLVVEAPVLTYLARTYAFQQVPLILWNPRRQPVKAAYYTLDAAPAVRKAVKGTDVAAVGIDTLSDSAPRDDLLLGVARTGEQIAAHQDCPRANPTSTDRPG